MFLCYLQSFQTAPTYTAKIAVTISWETSYESLSEAKIYWKLFLEETY